jgi:hypothetical protein
MKHLSWRIGIAIALVMSALTGPMVNAHATERGRVYAARHHAGARRVHRLPRGYSGKRRDLWGPAEMPPAPTDFGPHFDFPPASLNNGPTESPYPH